MRKSLLTLIIAGTAATPLLAENYTGGYVGGSLGTIDANFRSNGVSSDRDGISALSIYGGYNFNEYFGIEGMITSSEDLNNSSKVDENLGSFAITPKFTWNINQYVALFTKVGIASVVIVRDYDGEPGVIDETVGWSGVGLTAGIGAQFTIEDHFVVRASLESVDAELDSDDNILQRNGNSNSFSVVELNKRDVDFTNFNVGFHYQF